MKVVDTAIADVKIIEPKVFGDARGFFMEVWHARKFAEMGVAADFVQDNHSRSGPRVLRGLHYQVVRPQGKLVRCTAGAIFDVAVDIRRSSPTFKKWVAATLSAENKRQLWVPPGFAHGFLVLGEGAEVMYKCTDFYAPEYDRNLAWNDPEIAIDWPLDGTAPVLSAKDAAAPRLCDAEIFD